MSYTIMQHGVSSIETHYNEDHGYPVLDLKLLDSEGSEVCSWTVFVDGINAGRTAARSLRISLPIKLDCPESAS